MICKTLINLFFIISFLNFVQNLPVQDDSKNANHINKPEKSGKHDGLVPAPVNNVDQDTGIKARNVEHVEKNVVVSETEKTASEHKHTPPPVCHGERKNVDPAIAEEFRAKKHTRPHVVGEVKTTVAATTAPPTTTKKVVTTTTTTSKTLPTSTGSTKKPTKRHGIKFDANGDSIWEDDSDDSPDSEDVQKTAGKLDAEGNLIDKENQASGERDEDSEESEESDGIPLITIPLVDILNKYARMMGQKRASNSRYEYSYEDENEMKIREIKDKILDDFDHEDDDEDEKEGNDL